MAFVREGIFSENSGHCQPTRNDDGLCLKFASKGPVVKAIFLSVLIIAAIAIPILSQTLHEGKPSFDVASVKQNVSGVGYMDGTPGGRFIATGIPLRMLIVEAYGVRDTQLIGGPGWMNTDKWDVEAKPKEEDASRPDRGALMLQSLLEDRFQLKSHRETRELLVYELTVVAGGLKLKTSSGVPPGRPRMRMGRGSIEAYETSVAAVIRFLSNQLDRIVVDKTNLQGLYDFNLKWTPEVRPATGAAGATAPEPPLLSDPPSIFTALREQLGLKLESGKGPVEVLIIDSAERPAEN